MPSLRVIYSGETTVKDLQFESGEVIPVDELARIERLFIPVAGDGNVEDARIERIAETAFIVLPDGNEIGLAGFYDLDAARRSELLGRSGGEVGSVLLNYEGKDGAVVVNVDGEVQISENELKTIKSIDFVDTDASRIRDGDDLVIYFGDAGGSSLRLVGYYKLPDPPDLNFIDAGELSYDGVQVDDVNPLAASVEVDPLEEIQTSINSPDRFEIGRRIVDTQSASTSFLRELYFATEDVPHGTNQGGKVAGEEFGMSTEDGDDKNPAFIISVYNRASGASKNTVLNDVTVSYDILQGTTDSTDVDFRVVKSGSVTFQGGTSGPIRVPVSIHDDHLVEADEVFKLKLTGVSTDREVDRDSDTTFTYQIGGGPKGTEIGNYRVADNDESLVSIESVYADENDGTIRVVVRFTNPVDRQVTVDFEITGTPTTEAEDFTNLRGGSVVFKGSQNLNFPGAAQSDPNGRYHVTGEIVLAINQDDLVEATENLTISLTGVRVESGLKRDIALDPTKSSATVTLVDDDVATVSIVSLPTLNEDGSFEVTLRLDKPVDGGFDVTLNIASLTTDAGDVVFSGSSTVTFLGTGSLAAPEERKVTIDLPNDDIVENIEQFQLHLSDLVMKGPAPANRVDISDTEIVSIAANDTAAVTIGDVMVNEEAGTISFILTLDRAVEGGFRVDFNVAATGAGDGDALAEASDLLVATQTVAFAGTEGETVTITLPIQNEATVETNETFTVSLSNLVPGIVPANQINITDTATGTIINTDTAAVFIHEVTVTEGSLGGATVVVAVLSLSHPVEGGFTVTVTPSGLSPSAGEFTAGPKLVTFAGSPGETQTVAFDIAADDIVEFGETFTLTLSNPTVPGGSAALANITAVDTATVSILDDDRATVTIADIAVAEDGVATVSLTLSHAVQGGFSVDVVGRNGTALDGGSDFGQPTLFTANFVGNAGETQTITFQLNNDNLLENDEVFTAQLTNLVMNGGAPATSIDITDTANVTITDDDTAVANLSVTQQGVEGGTDIIFTVNLTNPNGFPNPITLDLASSGGTATNGLDYLIPAGAQIQIAPGATVGTYTVHVADDQLLEADQETIQATISSPSTSKVTVGTATAGATITDNDTAVANLSVTTGGVANGVEGGTNVVFTVTLDKVNNTGSAITFDIADALTGTATSGSDYTPFSGQVTIANGASTGTFTVIVTDDMLLETPIETVAATISNSSNPDVSIGTATAVATLADNDTTTADLSVTTNGTEGGTDVVFTVTLGKVNNTGAAITFQLADLGTGSGIAGSDYGAFPATITIADGSNTGTATITVTDDASLEGVETIAAQIINPSDPRVTIGTGTATATIADNETAAANLSVNVNAGEVGHDVVFTVTLDKANDTGAPITFDLADAATGTATSGIDYTAIPPGSQITIAAGATTGSFTVNVIDELDIEGVETIAATISNPSNGSVTIGTATVTGNIADGDAVPSFPTLTADLSITTLGLEAGPQDIVVTVTLDIANNTGGPLTFDLVDLGTGTATGLADYGLVPATVTIADGALTGTAIITVTNDAFLEAGLESINLQIQNPSASNVIIGTSTATATIADNETATADLSVTTNGVEGGTNIVYTVTLSAVNDTGQSITFDLADAGTGSATSNIDYTAIPAGARIVVANGATTGTFTVHVADDALLEADTETVAATISNPSAANVTIGTATASATITDNDTATANLGVTTEGVEGGTNIVFTVTLDKVNNTGAGITFDIADSATGTAASGIDYTAFGGQISVANGASTGTFTVFVTDDMLLEMPIETVGATIGNPSNADVTIGTASATATITDNDTATLSIAVAPGSVSEDGASILVYTVSLDKVNNTGVPITFDIVRLASSSAIEGTDYTIVGTASIADGSSSTSFTVDPTPDSTVEADETVILQILNPSDPRVSIGTATATGTISNDDPAALTIGDVTVNEEAGTIAFVVTLDRAVDGGFEVDVNIGVTGGNSGDVLAEAADLSVATRRIVFAGTAGEMVTVTLPIHDEGMVEANETFTVSLGNLTAPIVNTGSIDITDTATGTITNADAATVLIEDVTVTEGSGGGSTTVTAVLSLSHRVEGGFTVAVTPSGTSPNAGEFIGGAKLVTFAGTAGETRTVTFDIAADDVVEFDESFTLTLSNPTVPVGSAVNPANIIAVDAATATILDDDRAVVSVADISVSEGGVATVTLTLDRAVQGGFSVNVVGQNGSALDGGIDFTSPAGLNAIATFIGNAGETQTITFQITDDDLVENAESFTVQLKDLVMGVGAPATSIDITDTAVVTINDNDAASVTIDDVSVNENDGLMTFTLLLDRAVAGGFSVDVNFADGSAQSLVNGTDTVIDYENLTRTIQFTGTAGETKTVTVPIRDDALLERDETFTVSLGNLQKVDPNSAAIIDISDTATGTIENKDTIDVRIFANPGIPTIYESGSGPATTTFTVELSQVNRSNAPITISYSVGGTVQLAPIPDYVALSGMVSIPVGQRSANIVVNVLNDSLFDDTAQEIIVVTLQDTSNKSVIIDPAHKTAAIGIIDNEPVIIDLDGDGIEFANHRVDFDIDDDGATESVVWASGDDGFLVYDGNRSGTVDRRSEIVFTDHAPDAKTDLEAIRVAFDSDIDGALTASDKEWDNFAIWRDANENGVTDDGELVSLSALGILSIGLISDGLSSSPFAGATIHGHSLLTFENGSTSLVADTSLASYEKLDPKLILTHEGQVDLSSVESEASGFADNQSGSTKDIGNQDIAPPHPQVEGGEAFVDHPIVHEPVDTPAAVV